MSFIKNYTKLLKYSCRFVLASLQSIQTKIKKSHSTIEHEISSFDSKRENMKPINKSENRIFRQADC